MVAYQSARLLPSWENAAFRICVQVARVGAAASPGSVTSRLLERHVTERWCNESSWQINFDPQKAQSIILDRDATYWDIYLLQYSMYIWLWCTILFMLDGISRWPLNIWPKLVFKSVGRSTDQISPAKPRVSWVLVMRKLAWQVFPGKAC